MEKCMATDVVEKKPKTKAKTKPVVEAAVTVTGPKVGNEGAPIKGLTFGKLAELLPKLGVKVALNSRRLWQVLRAYKVLDFATFKVHPLRMPGSSLTAAWQGMTAAQKAAWVEAVFKMPPEDSEKSGNRIRFGALA